jgi:hypothetical protein
MKTESYWVVCGYYLGGILRERCGAYLSSRHSDAARLAVEECGLDQIPSVSIGVRRLSQQGDPAAKTVGYKSRFGRLEREHD